MGSICSTCFKSNKDEDGDENARLLENPAQGVDVRTNSINGTVADIVDGFSGGDTSGILGFTSGYQSRDATYGSLTGNNDSVNNAWSRTLDKMANNVIDVSLIESSSSNLEQSEWQERQRMYSSKLASTKVLNILKTQRNCTGVSSCSPTNLRLSADTVSKLRAAAQPIDQEDVNLIKEFSDKSVSAYKNGFVVNVKEQLVVKFDP